MEKSASLIHFIDIINKIKPPSLKNYIDTIRDNDSYQNDKTIEIIYDILNLGFDEYRKMGFSPQLVLTNGSRSFSIEDLTADEENILLSIVNAVPVIIQARIYDVIWSRKKHKDKNSCLQNAIKSYFQILENINENNEDDFINEVEITKQYIKRLKILIPINKSLNKEDFSYELHIKSKNYCVKFLNRSGYKNKFRVYSLIPIFIDTEDHDYFYRLTKNFFYYDMLHVSVNTPIEHSFKLLRGFLRDQSKIKKYYTDYAEYYVRLSDVDFKDRKLYQLKSHWLQKAVEIYMSHNLNKERFDELHRLLLESQEMGTNEFSSYESEPTDISHITKDIFSSFNTEMSFIDVLYNIATLPCFIRESYSELVDLTAEKGFSAFFQSIYTDERGRVISSDNTDKGRVIRYISDTHIRFAVSCLIHPSVHFINQLHYIDRESIAEFVSRSPFVRPGHETFFIRGIEAGFYGDWTLSSALLIPEIESSFKYLLENNGGLTSTFKPNNQKDKYSLEQIIKDLISEKIIRDMDGLLIEALMIHDLGHNIRNEYSHGLKNYDYYNRSFGPLYLWWLVIRFLYNHNNIFDPKEIHHPELIKPVFDYYIKDKIDIPEQSGIYAFWWIGDKKELVNSNIDFILSGPNKEQIKIRYEDWWPESLPFPCLYVGKTTNLKKRFSQHIKRKSEGRLHTFAKGKERVKRKTTSCQLRYGIEQIFCDVDKPLDIIMNKVGFSYRIDENEGATVRRFYDEDRLIGIWRPWFNLDSER